MIIHYSFCTTPISDCLLATSEQRICYLAFTQNHTQEESLQELQKSCPQATLQYSADIQKIAASLFSQPEKKFPVLFTRAVAHAIAQNKLAFLIPCHRVIKKSGDVHKYRWGGEIKAKLLIWEKQLC